MSPQLSALVVLRPRGGEIAAEDITAANAAQLQPDPGAGEAAAAFFRQAGFDVGPIVALSFAVSGPQALFERVFGTPLLVEGGGASVTARTQAEQLELPLDGLPSQVAGAVRAVAFTPPPDFGPAGTGP